MQWAIQRSRLSGSYGLWTALSKEPVVWIIRFMDGTMASVFGAKEKAVEMAEAKKEDYGGGYVIV